MRLHQAETEPLCSSFLFLYGGVNPSDRKTHAVMCFDSKTNESEERT